MVLKKFKNFSIAILLILFSIPIPILAYSDYVIPGGETIGIELNTKGVMIVGVYKVGEIYPASDAGLKVGDTITKVDGVVVQNIDDMVKKMNISNGSVTITYMRSNQLKDTMLKLYRDEQNVYKTGLYVKDSIVGIGTLSFIDPNTKKYGALGHEITEKNTGQILEIKDGHIFESEVTGVERSEIGTPGEKNAKLYSDQVTGTVSKNSNQGIFGTYTSDIQSRKQYKVAQPSEVKLGAAKMLTVLNGTTIEEYEVNIVNINKDFSQKTKNILFEITDQKLLQQTGGVVSGMSGSPIIQDDKIVAVVTHVVVDNPKRGYGIFITNMLEEADQAKG